jgi:O-antigen/teichoic acid export membrane protein
VPGAALQLVVAREAAAGRLGAGAGLRAVLARWQRLLLLVTAGVALVSVALRDPLAALAGVDEPWAAAIVPATGVLWIALSIGRGGLQGVGEHAAIARNLLLEGGARLAAAVALVAAGAGVAGALLGTALGMLVALAALAVATRRAVTGPDAPGRVRLRDLVAGSAAVVAPLVLLAVVQHVDVIVAQHRLDVVAASSYAAAAVAAKVVVWAAIGVALALLPELSRHARRGPEDGRRLLRTLALVGAVGVPFTLLCLVAGQPLLRLVFGPELDGAADALPPLAAAMTLFACASVAVQHSLALGQRTLVPVVAVVALAEPLLLRSITPGPEELAVALVLLQLGLAIVAVTLAVRAAPRLEPHRA